MLEGKIQLLRREDFESVGGGGGLSVGRSCNWAVMGVTLKSALHVFPTASPFLLSCRYAQDRISNVTESDGAKSSIQMLQSYVAAFPYFHVFYHFRGYPTFLSVRSI